MNHALSHIMNIHHFKVSKLYEYSDDQEYTTPTQCGRKKCSPAFLGSKNFIQDKISNKPLDKNIGKVTIKILYSLNVQLKMRHKATEYIKYNASKRIHYDLYF